jgi:hypothetical protein
VILRATHAAYVRTGEFDTAVDMGDAASQATFGAILVYGDARVGIAKDAARGIALVRDAFDQVGRCKLNRGNPC